jgi:YegS/Rv2252/BmrU family lipid kinase
MSAAVARRASLIVNPHAGGGRAAAVLPGVEERLRALGVLFHTERTRDVQHARDLARAAAARGEVAVTLSGDGLIGAVADELRATDGGVLGVLPGGRGNDFARVAGIPRDPLEACAVIAHGVERPLDLGEAAANGEGAGRGFIGIASLGFDSEANRIANEAPARLGQLVYVYGALRALVSWRMAEFAVEVDGERRTYRGWGIAAANSKAYGGGMYLAPDARLDDGALDVVMVSETSKLHFLSSLLPRVFKGTHVQLDSVRVVRGAEVRVSADRPFVVYADGDPIGDLPITLRAVPAALRVLLPADAGESGG